MRSIGKSWTRDYQDHVISCSRLHDFNGTQHKNVRVAPRTLLQALLNVPSSGCNNERQSLLKLSYSAIDDVLTNLLPAGLQDFFQVLNVLSVTTAANKLFECSPDRIVHWV